MMWPLTPSKFAKKHRCRLLTYTDEDSSEGELKAACPSASPYQLAAYAEVSFPDTTCLATLYAGIRVVRRS